MTSATDTIRIFPPEQVTDHFLLSEFASPAGCGCPGADYPAEWISTRLLPLCKTLEVLRAECGGYPVEILSGYRTREYNAARRAAGHDTAINSQHCEGLAADVRIGGISSAAVHACLLLLHRQGKIRLGGLGYYPEFVHLDLRSGETLAQWSDPARDVA